MQNLQNKLTSFRNFLVVAGADGKIQENEKEILVTLGVSFGLTPYDLKPLITAENLDFQLHDKFEDNEKDLGDMLTIAAADGVMLGEELAACKRFAKMAGIPDFKFEDMLQVALNQIDEDIENDFADGKLQENP